MPPIFEDFDTFCGDDNIQMGAMFSQNMAAFLRIYAGEVAEKPCHIEGMSAWYSTLLEFDRDKRLRVVLYTLREENLRDPAPTCDHCRRAGWSRHCVPKRNYHFIIPKHDKEEEPLDHGLLNLSNCRLYGLIHGDGYGHLLSVNGGGSESLRGVNIMDLWNRICTKLGARKISVRDVSKKYGMNLRLLLGVAFQQSWFNGKHGYNFSRGRFGVTEEIYMGAVEYLGSLNLTEVIKSFEGNEQPDKVEGIVKYYTSCSNEKELQTVGDLLQFMLTIRLGKSVKERRELAAVSRSMENELTQSELSVVLKVVDILRERQCLDGRLWMKLTNLIKEGALKSLMGELQEGTSYVIDLITKLDSKRIGNYIVKTRKIRNSHQLMLEDVGRPGCNIYSDIIGIYENVLLNCPGPGPYSEFVKGNVEAILNALQFLKTYPARVDANNGKQIFVCYSMPLDVITIDYPFVHGEVVVEVPFPATVAKLKEEAKKTVKEMYFICDVDQFEVQYIGVEDVLGGIAIEDDTLEFVGWGQKVWIIWDWTSCGNCLPKYQGGLYIWGMKVNCSMCHAVEDDCEPMVKCMNCNTSQHKQCLQTENDIVHSCLYCS